MVGVLALLFIGMFAGQVLTPVLEPPFRTLAQKSNEAFPSRILPEGDILTLHRRKFMSENIFLAQMKKVGFGEGSAKSLFIATQFFPNVQDGIRFAVREAFREDIATLFDLDANFDLLPLDFFEKMGVDKETLRLFWRSHWELPGISQGFEMYQRLSDVQLPFKQDTVKQLGLKDSDVVTNQFELNTLLTTLDVMKPWQKRLTMIAYNPITRIDIRRFIEKGVIKVDEAEFRYREIGNSPEDARLQVKFIRTEILLDEIIPLLKRAEISPEEAIEKLAEVTENRTRAKQIVDTLMITAKKSRTVKEKDLTRSQMENAVEDGLISDDDFLAGLQNQGLDVDESNIVLQLLKNKLAEKETKVLEKQKKFTKSDTITGYILGNISRSEAEDKLDELRFDNDSIELMMLNADSKIAAAEKRLADKSKRESERKFKEQSKSDTTKALKQGTITEEKAISELREARFSDEAIQIILSTVITDEQ